MDDKKELLLFNLVDIAAKVRLTHSAVWKHYTAGRFPAPQCVTSRTPLWDAEGYQSIVGYFKARKSRRSKA